MSYTDRGIENSVSDPSKKLPVIVDMLNKVNSQSRDASEQGTRELRHRIRPNGIEKVIWGIFCFLFSRVLFPKRFGLSGGRDRGRPPVSQTVRPVDRAKSSVSQTVRPFGRSTAQSRSGDADIFPMIELFVLEVAGRMAERSVQKQHVLGLQIT